MPELAQTGSLALGVAAAALLLAWVAATVRAGALGARGRVPLALAAPLDETCRLLRQRRRTTVAADSLLWRVASTSLLPVALLMLGLVPWGGEALLPHSLSLVWVNALDVVVWALVWLVGWGPNSVVGLVGGYRFLALGLGYELPLMFALVAPPIAAGSLDLAEIAGAQGGLWYVVWMPVAFLAYCIGVLGFSLRAPLDSGVSGDLSGGVAAELSGLDRLLVQVGRHALLGAGAAVAVPLFLGGGSGPLLPAAVWVLTKAVLLTGVLAWISTRLPTIRPQRLLEPAWVVLLPLVVVQDLVVAAIALGTR